ncbi:MAG: endo-1,4-beta-xylanase [Lachnospiraceae bacterium]|nr:endo-1,4-beta-xylanase [Lachnospiraceae bacterium]
MSKFRKLLWVTVLCVFVGCAQQQKPVDEDVTPTQQAEDISPTEVPETVATVTPEATATPVPEGPSEEDLYWQGVLESFSRSKYDLTAALTGTALKDLCKGYFKLGVGMTGSAYNNLAIHSDEYMAITKKHFNSVTLTNLFKPSYLLDQMRSKKNAAEGNGEPAVDFSGVEESLQWCMDNGVQMRGHTIVWHTQTPDWYFREGYETDGAYVDRETMLFRLDSYTKQVMQYCQDNFPGVVYCWDVVNEAVDPGNGDPDSFYRCRMENDGTPNQWYYVVGDDYVEQAFRIARKYAADGVSLFYNDFNTYDTQKRECIYNLCKALADEGLIDGIGMQGYWGIGYPSVATIETTIKKFAELGLEIQITEMSVGVDDITEEEFEKQAKRYSSIFYMLSYVDIEGGGPANITSVTLFGLMDGYVFYGGSDTTTTRLFDTNFQPKPAFDSVKNMLEIAYKNRTK